LRVEGENEKVSLPRDVLRHLPNLPTNGGTPVDFLWLVVLGDASHELTQVVPTSHAANRCRDGTKTACLSIQKVV